MSNANKWINENLLTININKTCYMFYHKTRNKKSMDENNTLKINYVPINRVESINFLGIIIDEKLSFKQHTKNLINKLSYLNHLAYKLKDIMNNIDKIKIYYAYYY